MNIMLPNYTPHKNKNKIFQHGQGSADWDFSPDPVLELPGEGVAFGTAAEVCGDLFGMIRLRGVEGPDASLLFNSLISLKASSSCFCNTSAFISAYFGLDLFM